MFGHILVPVSRVQEARHALDVAPGMVKETHGTVTLLHVIELVQEVPEDTFAEFYEMLEHQAGEDLKSAEAPTPQVDLRRKIVYGQRVREILDYADKQSVDLIVLQSHPIDLADPTRGWGTISYRVAILARCPVMLVK